MTRMSDGPRLQPRWFQFTIRGMFVAVFWAAVFSGSFVLFKRLSSHVLVAPENEGSAYLILGCLLFTSIPAAVGSLFRRAMWGAVFGLVAYALYVAWILFAINTWGGT